MYSFITERQGDTSHVVVESKRMTIQEWEQAGMPETWERKETLREHEAWVDSAYGYVAYFNTTTGYISVGKAEFPQKAYDSLVVVLDRDYFGTPKYLYF